MIDCNIINILRGYQILVLLCCLGCSSVVYGQDPESFITNLSNELIVELKQNYSKLQADPDIAYDIAKRVIIPKVNVLVMSRSVLGRKVWSKMSKLQQEQFTELFTNLIMKTYSKSLTGYNDDTFKVLPLGDRYQDKDRVVVKSVLMRKQGPKITLKYRMVITDNVWSIYDVTVEGISLLQNFRTQFSAELSKGTIDELITKMQQH